MAQVVAGTFVYSGGVSTLEDLRCAERARGRSTWAGVIVGKALYERRFTVAEGQAALDRTPRRSPTARENGD